MSTYDVAICIGEENLTRLLRNLFDRPSLRDSLFKGSESVDLPGGFTAVTWEALQPPSVSLSAPSEAQWKSAVKPDGTAPAPSANAFLVHIPDLRIGGRKASGEGPTTTTKLDVICTMALSGNAVSFQPQAVIIDLSHTSLLQPILKRLTVRVLELVQKALAVEHLPNIDFRGLSFGAANLAIGGGRAIGVARLRNGDISAPPIPPHEQWPPGNFSVLLSPAAVQRALDLGVAALKGKEVTKSGSQDVGLGNASYHAAVRFDSIAARVRADSPEVVDASVSLALRADAGIDVTQVVLKRLQDAGRAVADAGKKVGDGVVDTGKKVGDGVVDTGKKIAGGVVDTAHKVAEAFHGY